MLTHKDVPGKNAILKDEIFLCEKDIQYCGQPVAIVVAGKYLVFDWLLLHLVVYLQCM